MSPFVVLLIVVGTAAVIALAVGAGSALPRLNLRRNAELKAVKFQLRSAKAALRTIANGASGNPVLEAQIALDEIDRKELEA